MTKLNWKILTKKRPGVTQGLPPGKEDLAWVTNTVTLIHGERDAILVDTFLSVEHSKDTRRLARRERKKSHSHLHHSCPWRPLPRSETPVGSVPRRASVCHCHRRDGYARTNQARF